MKNSGSAARKYRPAVHKIVGDSKIDFLTSLDIVGCIPGHSSRPFIAREIQQLRTNF
jgi:hypothetical protein